MTPTIQDIFEMRRNGRFEEAYQAILPLYREHHGHYSTLCMFWTATDVMKMRIEAEKVCEAERLLASLLNIYPRLDDKDHSGARTLNRLALQLATKEQELKRGRKILNKQYPDADPMQFSLLDYMQDFGNNYMSEDDWQATEWNGHQILPIGVKVLSRIFHEVNNGDSTPEQLNNALGMVLIGLQHLPNSKELLRYQCHLLYRTGEKETAIRMYRKLCERSRESYMLSELSSMLDDKQEKAALLAKAIINNRYEVFAQKDRISLAKLIAEQYPANAAYELQQVILLRDSLGTSIPADVREMARDLAEVTPVSDKEQREFYRQLIKG